MHRTASTAISRRTTSSCSAMAAPCCWISAPRAGIIGDMTQALTMVLKPGFAPIEQYVDDGAMPMGAWTDIYQVGALIHQAATGRTPATSVARMVTDPMQPLTSEQVPGYSDAFLQGMQKALAVRPQDRPQSIAELRSLLGLSAENRAAPAPVEPSPSPIYIPITTPAAVQAAMASESASAQAPRFLPITETYVPAPTPQVAPVATVMPVAPVGTCAARAACCNGSPVAPASPAPAPAAMATPQMHPHLHPRPLPPTRWAWATGRSSTSTRHCQACRGLRLRVWPRFRLHPFPSSPPQRRPSKASLRLPGLQLRGPRLRPRPGAAAWPYRWPSAPWCWLPSRAAACCGTTIPRTRHAPRPWQHATAWPGSRRKAVQPGPPAGLPGQLPRRTAPHRGPGAAQAIAQRGLAGLHGAGPADDLARAAGRVARDCPFAARAKPARRPRHGGHRVRAVAHRAVQDRGPPRQACSGHGQGGVPGRALGLCLREPRPCADQPAADQMELPEGEYRIDISNPGAASTVTKTITVTKASR